MIGLASPARGAMLMSHPKLAWASVAFVLLFVAASGCRGGRDADPEAVPMVPEDDFEYIIAPGQEDKVVKLFEPFGVDREVAPSLVLRGISIKRAIISAHIEGPGQAFTLDLYHAKCRDIPADQEIGRAASLVATLAPLDGANADATRAAVAPLVAAVMANSALAAEIWMDRAERGPEPGRMGDFPDRHNETMSVDDPNARLFDTDTEARPSSPENVHASRVFSTQEAWARASALVWGGLGLLLAMMLFSGRPAGWRRRRAAVPAPADASTPTADRP